MDLRKLKPKTTTVEIEGDTVTLRELGAGELVAMGAFDDQAEVQFTLLAKSIVGSDGEPYMSEDDVRALPWSVVAALTGPAMDIQGLVDTEEKKSSSEVPSTVS